MKKLLLLFSAIIVAGSVFAFQRVFLSFGTADGLSDNSAQALYCLPDGRMVIASQGRINIYDGSKFANLPSSPDVIYELAAYNGRDKVYLDRHNHLWHKNRRQVRCLDLKTERYITEMGPFAHNKRRAGKVRDLFVDCQGCVWYVVGDSLHGYDSKFAIKLPKEKATLQDLDTWKDKALLLFMSDGKTLVYDINQPRKQPQSISTYSEEKANLYDAESVVSQESDGIYQIRNGENNGILLRIDPEKLSATTLLETPYALNGIALRGEHLYVPCQQGYWNIDTKTLTTEHHDEIRLYGGRTLQTSINDVCFDHQRGVWLATQTRGLFYARPYRRQFEVYETSDPKAASYLERLKPVKPITYTNNQECLCAITDSRGWKWIGTNDGIFVIKKGGKNAKETTETGNQRNSSQLRITRRDGLANDIVHSLVEDKEGNIWAATSLGVSAILVTADTVRFINNYSNAEGVPISGFIDGKAVLLSDSSIIMQSHDNIVRFRPHRFTTLHRFDDFPLTPILTRLQLKGNPVGVGREVDGHVILDKAPAFTDTLTFTHSENIVQLTFTALNFTRPRQTYYRVRIPELSDEWTVYSPFDANGNVDKTGQLHLPLINLLPGEYTVEVQASLFPFTWKGETKTMHIVVNQPWWRTRGLRLMALLLICAIAAVCLWLYTRNLKMKLRVADNDNDMLMRLRRYFTRCRSWGNTLLAPSKPETEGRDIDDQQDLTDEQVRQLMKIDDIIDDPDATIDLISEQTDIATEKIYSLIADTKPKSPRRLIVAMQLKRAASEIKQGDTDMAAIARRHNFATLEYFRRCFQRYYGCLPEDYR